MLLGVVHAAGAFEDLEQDLVVLDLEDLAATHGAVGQLDVDDVAVLGLVHHLHQHQRALDVRYGLVLFHG